MSVINRTDLPPPVLAAPRPPDRALPLFKFIRVLRQSSIATFESAAYDQDLIVRRMLWRRSFLVNEPGAIKYVLLDNAANYTKTEFARRMLEPGLGRGLLTSEGEKWRKHRRIMAPSFDHRSVVGYAPIMTSVTENLLEKWDESPDGAVVDVAADMMRTTLHIISKTMFSSDSDDIVDIVEDGVTRYQSSVRPNLLDVLGAPEWAIRMLSPGRGVGILTEFDRAMERLIADRGRAGARDSQSQDLLTRLISARDEETGGGMTAQEVRDQVVTIFMAGHETTALALTWAWYLLSQHPAAEAKLHAEVDSVLAGRTPRHQDIANLPYTRMVIEEAMRLYPPAHTLSRTAINTDEVLGQRVPAGATILIVPWLIHRRRSIWKDPDRFVPERFAPEQTATRHRFSYIPFGAGPRICIGMAFAMAEASLILATIAQRYRLRLATGHPVEPQGLITLRPRHGMLMQRERRR
jgi:cytochrome P450